MKNYKLIFHQYKTILGGNRMSINSIEDKMRTIIKTYTDIKVPIEEIGINQNLTAIGMDSISCMKVIVAMEETFNFEVEDDDLILENFQDISSQIRFIEFKTLQS